MDELKHTFSYKKFWDPNELKPYVEFSRKGTHYCIYCGAISDTREHSPSKVFLSKPYPEDLPVLPACKKCNNGFSSDELYTEIYIDAMKFLSGRTSYMSEKNQERMYLNSAFLDAQNDLKGFYNTGYITSNEKILHILTKLAICHMIYELTEGYYHIKGCCIYPSSIKYKLDFEMTKQEKEEYDEILFMSDKKLPSIGSRVYDRIYVLSTNLTAVDRTHNSDISLVMMDWNDIQDNEYRYICWLENNHEIHVKIVIHDFLYAEIIFPQ